jgi:hypothetical protein
MRGVSAASGSADQQSYRQITLTDDLVRVHVDEFDREANDETLLAWSDEVVGAFAIAEKAVLDADAIDLSEDTCRTALDKLAKWGRIAFRGVFSDDAQESVRYWLPVGETPAITPTFFSQAVPFPWEVLYDGPSEAPTDRDHFWGFRMAPARILNKTQLSRQVLEQPLPSDMLFCLHVDLRDAHERERPELERIVLASRGDRFLVLSAGCGVRAMRDGADLLTYLMAEANHTMVHFACHCDPGDAGEDVLHLSVLAATPDGDVQLLHLGTTAFLEVDAKAFRTKPLVFMNACHSGGGVDQIRKMFNLPRTFVRRGAGAVIATACPVPDLFAAAFARHFYALFLGATPRLTIGEALRQTRLHFLEQHNNPLGLAYGLYTPAQYRLALAPNAVEAALAP